MSLNEHDFSPESLDDEALLMLINGGSDASAASVLIDRYMPLIKRKAGRYGSLGLETEDLIQEGLVGLIKAVRHYDAGRNSSFGYFASVCISSSISNAVAYALSGKNRPMRNYSSIEEIMLAEDDPQSSLIRREEMTSLMNGITKMLSPLEKDVLRLYLSGYTYRTIAEDLGCGVKSVDNALMRIRKKLRTAYNAGS